MAVTRELRHQVSALNFFPAAALTPSRETQDKERICLHHFIFQMSQWSDQSEICLGYATSNAILKQKLSHSKNMFVCIFLFFTLGYYFLGELKSEGSIPRQKNQLFFGFIFRQSAMPSNLEGFKEYCPNHKESFQFTQTHIQDYYHLPGNFTSNCQWCTAAADVAKRTLERIW